MSQFVDRLKIISLNIDQIAIVTRLEIKAQLTAATDDPSLEAIQ